MRVTAVSAGCKFPIYCCSVNFKTAGNPARSPRESDFGLSFSKRKPPKSNNDGRIRRMWAGQEPTGLAQSALSKEGECPFLVEEKQAFAPPSFPTNPNPNKPQGACCCRTNVSRLGGTASLEPVPVGRDKAKSRWVQQVKERLRRRVGKSSSTLRYMDAAVRRDERKVVFYQAQK